MVVIVGQVGNLPYQCISRVYLFPLLGATGLILECQVNGLIHR